MFNKLRCKKKKKKRGLVLLGVNIYFFFSNLNYINCIMSLRLVHYSFMTMCVVTSVLLLSYSNGVTKSIIYGYMNSKS